MSEHHVMSQGILCCLKTSQDVIGHHMMSLDIMSIVHLMPEFGPLCSGFVVFNSFSAGLRPANLAPAPGQICKQTLSYHKTRKKSFFRLVFGVIRIIFHRRNFWAQKMFHTTISSARARVRKKRSIRETTSLVAQIKHGYDVILRRWRRRS